MLTVDVPSRMRDYLLDDTLVLEILQRCSRERSIDLQPIDQHGYGNEAV